MGWTERAWDAFVTTIKLADKVEQLNVTVIKHHHIEDLIGRVIRLETALELGQRAKQPKRLSGPPSKNG